MRNHSRAFRRYVTEQERKLLASFDHNHPIVVVVSVTVPVAAAAADVAAVGNQQAPLEIDVARQIVVDYSGTVAFCTDPHRLVETVDEMLVAKDLVVQRECSQYSPDHRLDFGTRRGAVIAIRVATPPNSSTVCTDDSAMESARRICCSGSGCDCCCCPATTSVSLARMAGKTSLVLPSHRA